MVQRIGRARLWTITVVVALMIAGICPPLLGRARAVGEWQTGWSPAEPSSLITALGLGPGGLPTVLAATPAGLYQSPDLGNTWLGIGGSPQNIVTMATGNPSTIYVYSWPGSGPNPNPTQGLFKSVNGGASWQDPTGGSSAGTLGPVRTLAVQPGNAQVVLAGSASFPASGNKICRSADGGVTWTAVYTVPSLMGAGSVFEIVPARSNPNVFYAAHDAYHGGAIVKSVDGGQTWTVLQGGVESLSYPAVIAVDPGDPNRVLAISQLPTGAGVRLFKTIDGGQSWTKTGGGLPQGGAFVQDLITDPTNGQLVFAAFSGDGAGVYRSDDGGDNWSLIEGSSTAPLTSTNVLAFDSKTRILFAGTNRGVWQKVITSGVTSRFVDYYNSHDGWRVLGRALSSEVTVDGWPSQYFEKGRLEDHSRVVSDPNWRFMFGLLADELQNAEVTTPVGGESSTLNYADLHLLTDPAKRLPAPQGFGSGIWQNADGSVFVPYKPDLSLEAGHNVPQMFWAYVNRTDLFPGGWIHDIGLPMTEAVQAVVDKGDLKGRTITVQAFQRTVLTYDPLNPTDWQVERANVGADYLKTMSK